MGDDDLAEKTMLPMEFHTSRGSRFCHARGITSTYSFIIDSWGWSHTCPLNRSNAVAILGRRNSIGSIVFSARYNELSTITSYNNLMCQRTASLLRLS
jgi:hypothetical protein